MYPPVASSPSFTISVMSASSSTTSIRLPIIASASGAAIGPVRNVTTAHHMRQQGLTSPSVSPGGDDPSEHRNQFVRLHRLAKIVLKADVERLAAVFVAGERGECDRRHRIGFGLALVLPDP